MLRNAFFWNVDFVALRQVAHGSFIVHRSAFIVQRSSFNDEKVKTYPVTRHVTLVVHRSPFIIHIQRSFNLNGTVHSFIVQLCKILTLVFAMRLFHYYTLLFFKMSGHQMSDDEASNEDDVDVKRVVVICEVKERVFLYDPTHPDHTKRNIRLHKSMKLLERFNRHPREVEEFFGIFQ